MSPSPSRSTSVGISITLVRNSPNRATRWTLHPHKINSLDMPYVGLKGGRQSQSVFSCRSTCTRFASCCCLGLNPWGNGQPAAYDMLLTAHYTACIGTDRNFLSRGSTARCMSRKSLLYAVRTNRSVSLSCCLCVCVYVVSGRKR